MMLIARQRLWCGGVSLLYCTQHVNARWLSVVLETIRVLFVMPEWIQCMRHVHGTKKKKNLHVSIVVRRNYTMYVALDCTSLRYSHHECVSNIVSVSQVYVCVREISSVKTVVDVLLRGCVQSRWRIAKAIGKMTVMQTVPFKFALFTLVFGHI